MRRLCLRQHLGLQVKSDRYAWEIVTLLRLTQRLLSSKKEMRILRGHLISLPFCSKKLISLSIFDLLFFLVLYANQNLFNKKDFDELCFRKDTIYYRLKFIQCESNNDIYLISVILS